MENASITERYRPKRIADFTGLRRPKAILTTFIKRPHGAAFLFIGPSGRGKSTMALALADELQAEVHHVPSGKCDQAMVNELSTYCRYQPMLGNWHFIIVDEADKMTMAAQLSFLSKLDATEGFENTIIVFTCNSTDLLEPRFLSRMMRIQFDAEGMDTDLPKYLASVAKHEGVKVGDFQMLARSCQYNVRDALNQIQLEAMGAGYLADMEPQSEHSHAHKCPICRDEWHCDTEDCRVRPVSPCKMCEFEAAKRQDTAHSRKFRERQRAERVAVARKAIRA